MRVLKTLLQTVALLLCSETAFAASSWTFSDASVSVQGKGSGVGGGLKEKFVCCMRHEIYRSLMLSQAYSRQGSQVCRSNSEPQTTSRSS